MSRATRSRERLCRVVCGSRVPLEVEVYLAVALRGSRQRARSRLRMEGNSVPGGIQGTAKAQDGGGASPSTVVQT